MNLCVQGFTLVINTFNKKEREEKKRKRITLTKHKKSNYVKKQEDEKDRS